MSHRARALSRMTADELKAVARFLGVRRGKRTKSQLLEVITAASADGIPVGPVECWRCGADPSKPQSRQQPELTPALQEEICRLIERGNYTMTAAQACGVSPRALANWNSRGRAGEEPFAAFVHATARALAKAEADIVDEIRTAESEKDRSNRALQWLLERTRRERFGPSISVKIEEAKETLLDAAARVLAPTDLENLMAALESHNCEVEGDPGLRAGEPIH